LGIGLFTHLIGIGDPIMLATQFLEKSRDPNQWRKHSLSLRRSAEVLWEDFAAILVDGIKQDATEGKTQDFSAAIEALETTKLLYGLALETALKAWIVEKHPEKIEIRVTLDGTGEASHAELRAVGVSNSNGHNLLALAEAAGVFGPTFQKVLKTTEDKAVIRNICRDLGEVVIWRGRYPVPLSSSDPLVLDPSVPTVAVAHYLRDFLDPLLDALLYVNR
jgi:hypothetical protein